MKNHITIFTILVVAIACSACQTPNDQLNNDSQGGTVKIGIPSWFDTIDPLNEDSSAYSAWGPGIAYSRILRHTNASNLDGTQNLQKLTCDACEKWSMESPTEFRFLIKDEILWTSTNTTDNRKYLSAYDIEYSFKASKKQNHTFHMIKNIKARSDTDLAITLNYPDADFLTSIANGKNKIIKETDIAAVSGSWVLDDHIPYTLTRMNKSLNAETIPNIDSIDGGSGRFFASSTSCSNI